LRASPGTTSWWYTRTGSEGGAAIRLEPGQRVEHAGCRGTVIRVQEDPGAIGERAWAVVELDREPGETPSLVWIGMSDWEHVRLLGE
jgi:hypothetical protein